MPSTFCSRCQKIYAVADVSAKCVNCGGSIGTSQSVRKSSNSQGQGVISKEIKPTFTSTEAFLAQINTVANPQMPKVGDRYLGTVTKVASFGAFISLMPGKDDGLLHITQLHNQIGKPITGLEYFMKVGDKIAVEIADVDPQGKLALKPVLEDGTTAAYDNKFMMSPFRTPPTPDSSAAELSPAADLFANFIALVVCIAIGLLIVWAIFALVIALDLGGDGTTIVRIPRPWRR